MMYEKGTRVRVWDGDGKTPLGDGTYQGEVHVYFIRTPGSLLSMHDPTQRPPDELVDELGGEVEEMLNNPQILLDSGETVYGCQVWFRPIPGGQS